MISIAGFNGFHQLSTVVKLACKENLNHSNEEKNILLLHSIKELFTINDRNYQDLNINRNIAFSWSYCVVYCGNSMWLCGYNQINYDLILKVQAPNDLHIYQVSCNRNQVVCVMEGGSCWMYILKRAEWRDLKNIPNTEQSDDDKAPERIDKVCCGETVTVTLTKNGSVYNTLNKLSIPRVKIVDVACGHSHILLLSDGGEVYSVGEGSRGQLGHGELENEEEPRLVEALAGLRVVAIACGGWHSQALTTDGDLYSWGWNMAGQLGLPSKDTTNVVSVQAVPHVVDWPNDKDVRVLKVACGARHTLALLDDGSVWGCGWNGYGQLALPGVESTNCMTRLPTTSGPVREIICGPWNSLLIT